MLQCITGLDRMHGNKLVRRDLVLYLAPTVVAAPSAAVLVVNGLGTVG